MVAIVTLVFSICWLPLTLYIISANVFDNKTRFLYYFKMIANSFAYLNSAINPVLYAFLNRSFRNNCGNILTRPTCSLLCRKNYQQQSQQQQQQRHSNHKPTICYLTKEKNIIIDNDKQLLPNNMLNSDFSDAEYETPDLDCLPEATIDDIEHQNNNSFNNQHRITLMNPKYTDDRRVTTSL